MADKKTVKLKDLINLGTPVDISETEQIIVRALSLREMVTLFIESRDSFLGLYQAGLDGATPENLAPFLITAPDIVAKIISLASDEPESAQLVEERMPGTVQLIALSEIWRASVPDPKKAKELLSEVMALLQSASAKVNVLPEAEQTSSQTNLPVPLNS